MYFLVYILAMLCSLSLIVPLQALPTHDESAVVKRASSSVLAKMVHESVKDEMRLYTVNATNEHQQTEALPIVNAQAGTFGDKPWSITFMDSFDSTAVVAVTSRGIVIVQGPKILFRWVSGEDRAKVKRGPRHLNLNRYDRKIGPLFSTPNGEIVKTWREWEDAYGFQKGKRPDLLDFVQIGPKDAKGRQMFVPANNKFVDDIKRYADPDEELAPEDWVLYTRRHTGDFSQNFSGSNSRRVIGVRWSPSASRYDIFIGRTSTKKAHKRRYLKKEKTNDGRTIGYFINTEKDITTANDDPFKDDPARSGGDQGNEAPCDPMDLDYPDTPPYVFNENHLPP